MPVGTRGILRVTFSVLVLVSALVLIQGYAAQPSVKERVGTESTGERVADPRQNVTVITTSERVADDSRANAIVALSPAGDVLYFNDSHTVYNDVDPSSAGDRTVTYVAADRLNRSACRATTECWLNVVEQVNLTTGEVTRLYSRITTADRGQWHDVDRINDTHLLVADIALDRLFLVNHKTGIVDWQWDAQSEFPIRGGGLFPGDWTHVNDVELLDDGRVMASLRNQDQVVFIDPNEGLQENWTLGAENDHRTLFEQHNPDYIPPERGGPAIVLADSENNRVVEYQRRSGRWERTWTWQDVDLQWPRDVDRLPNGHTLITDSNGRRVIEIDETGEVVWSISINGAYDAERLGTGDESATGRAATALDLQSRGDGSATTASRQTGDGDSLQQLLFRMKALAPGLVLNALLFVLPAWIGFVELLALALVGIVAVVWLLAELQWSAWSIRLEVQRSDEKTK